MKPTFQKPFSNRNTESLILCKLQIGVSMTISQGKYQSQGNCGQEWVCTEFCKLQTPPVPVFLKIHAWQTYSTALYLSCAVQVLSFLLCSQFGRCTHYSTCSYVFRERIFLSRASESHVSLTAQVQISWATLPGTSDFLVNILFQSGLFVLLLTLLCTDLSLTAC